MYLIKAHQYCKPNISSEMCPSHQAQYRTIHRDMMGAYTILVCLAILGTTVGSTRYTRDTEECAEARVIFKQCTTK